MRFVFLLPMLVLGLSACAQANTIADTTNACERRPDPEATWRMVEPGVISTGGAVSSGKYLVGGVTNTAGCVRQEENKGTAPQMHDLQKVG